jgi:hypothetical protein
MRCFYRKKIVLCLNAHQLIAAVWFGRKYHSSHEFVQNHAGQAAFAKFLGENITAVFSLIVDVAEEDYQFQHIPHTTGRAKTELLKRKLDQFYRGMTYKAASYYGRAQNQARSDCYLFSAIRHDKNLQLWIDLLQAAEIDLEGIRLLPMLTELMLHLHTEPKANLLLCEQLSSGLRQSFFANGRLQISRLLPDIAQIPELSFQAAEIEKTRLYLVNQRLIEADAALDLILLNINQCASLQIIQPNVASSLHISLSELAKSLKLPLAKVEAMPELIHMQLLVNGSKVANLAPPVLTEKYRTHQLKLQHQWLSVLLLMIYFSLGMHFYQQGLHKVAELKRLAPQLKAAEYRYQQEITTSRVLNHDVRKIKTTVDLAKQISDLPITPVRMMRVLSSGFEVFSEAELELIELISFDWAPNLDEVNNTLTWQETALVEMEITGEAGKLLKQYIEILGSNRHVMRVEVLDGEKQSAWHGNTALTQDQTTQKFKLKVTLKAKAKVESATPAGRQS